MSDFDPVPREALFTSKQAAIYIPELFIGGIGANPTPREFAMQILIDTDLYAQAEIALLQRQARHSIGYVFEFMHDWILGHGGGRHIQKVIVAMALHPERDTVIDVEGAGREYLDASSRTQAEIEGNGMLLGHLAQEAILNAEENEAKVKAGEVHIPSGS